MSDLIHHKKARFDYEILETFDAGIELFGFEVKAIRDKRGSLEGSHITVRGREAYLIGCHIPPYQSGNTPKESDSNRHRRLLLTKKELNELAGKESEKGLTLIALSMYNKGRKIKVKIASVRGKKAHDKRDTIKKRETDREIRRTLKNEL